MKRLFFLILILSAKAVSAQSFFLGGNLGLGIYHFRQQPTYSDQYDFPFGVTGQFYSGNRIIGDELNLNYMPLGPDPAHTDTTSIIGDINLSDYIIISPFTQSKIAMLQFKVGGFYTKYFTTRLNPQNDYGPAVAIDLTFKAGENNLISLEVSKQFGLANYYTYENQNLFQLFFGSNNPSGNSNITYTNFSIKFAHKLN